VVEPGELSLARLVIAALAAVWLGTSGACFYGCERNHARADIAVKACVEAGGVVQMDMAGPWPGTVQCRRGAMPASPVEKK
jgi:hypothetical protein